MDEQKLLQKFKNEYKSALEYRQTKEQDWLENERLFNLTKKKSVLVRSNAVIPVLHETINTFLSKVDTPPNIEYNPSKPQYEQAAFYLNEVWKFDSNFHFQFNLLDLLAKKECAIYGRGIYKFNYDVDNDRPEMYVVDVLDFLIDPSAGYFLQNARFMGQDNIYKSIYELESDDKYQNIDKVKALLQARDEMKRQQSNSGTLEERQEKLGLPPKEITSESVKLTEWYTYVEGEKYYILVAEDEVIIRAGRLSDIFTVDDFPFISFAYYPRVFQFWSPSLADVVREPNKIMNVIINQIIDNNTYQNFGMIAYDINKVKRPSDLNPRPQGVVAVDGDPRNAVHRLQVGQINNAIDIYALVNRIVESATGVTSAQKGIPQSKSSSATEFAATLAQSSDRIKNFINFYNEEMKNLAYLYKDLVQENLKQRYLKIYQDDETKFYEVGKGDIKGDFYVLVSTSIDEQSRKLVEAEKFIKFRQMVAGNPNYNQKELDKKLLDYFIENPDEKEKILNNQDQQAPQQQPAIPQGQDVGLPDDIMQEVKQQAQNNIPAQINANLQTNV